MGNFDAAKAYLDLGWNVIPVNKSTKRPLVKWEQYQNDIRNEGIDKMIVDYKKFIEEKLNECSNGYVTEQGDVESWVGGFDREQVLIDMEEGIKYLESLKKS